MCKKLIFLISLFLVFALLGSNACLAGVIDVKIASGTDDAEEGPGSNGYYTDSSDLEMVDDDADNGGRQLIGLHFKSIGIPAGATITNAYIEFTCDELKDSSDPAYLLLSGHLTEDPESFGSGTALLSERPLTVAQVSWAPENWTAENQKSQTADISSIIQELVDQAGWVAGNALEIIIDEDTAEGAFTGVRVAESYDGEAEDAAVLHVEFEGEAVEPTEPTISGTWFEAEDADPLTSPLETYFDDANASGGGYMGVAMGNNSTGSSPAPDGTASYVFDVPETGTYKVFVRAKLATGSYDDDSAYARIDGATYSSGSDWIKWNNIYGFIGTEWAWLPIHNNDDGDAVVEFTMDAGQYTLEIAYREDGVYFDAILITDDLGIEASSLPDAVPSGSSCTEPENLLVNAGFEDGVEDPWYYQGTPVREIVTDAQEGTYALKIEAIDGSNDWDICLKQNEFGKFEAGKKYTYAVFMKCETGTVKVHMKPELDESPNTGYGEADFDVTTEWKEYYVTTPEFSSEVNPATVTIFLALEAGTVYVDHARLYEGDYVEPCTPDGPAPVIVKATKPMPENSTDDLTRFNLLSWTPGEYADSHNVYLGTDQQAVTDATVDNPMDVLVSQQQADAFYMASGDYGKTYYWRVDEVNEADMTIYPGNIWKFTTKPIGLIVPQESITVTASGQYDEDQSPEKTIDESGLTGDLHGTDGIDMWRSDPTEEPNQAWIRYDFDQLYKMPLMLIWNYNQDGIFSTYGIQECLIEYSSDEGATWTALDVNELPQGAGTDLEPLNVDLGGVADGYAINALRITAISNYRDSFPYFGLSEVRFYYVPVIPTNPSPADGETNVVVNPTLSWDPGEGVVEHMVYFGTDEQAVENGTASSYVVNDPEFAPAGLELGETYFWRVVEVNMASVPANWSGDTWSFSTNVFTVVDDFEGYSNSINKWSGGAALSLDTDIANDGSQSMKFMYDNTGDGGYYTEISANPSQLASGSNWTKGSPEWLVFYVYGDLQNVTTERMYVKLDDAVYWRHDVKLIENSDLLSPWWTQVQIPLVPYQVNLNNVGSIKIGFTQTGVETGSGEIHVDDIRLYKNAPVPVEPVNPGDANLVARYKMENNVNDSSSNGIDGTILGDPQFVANEYSGYGKALVFDANEDVVDLGPADPFNFAGSFTVSLWANIADWSGEWQNAMVATHGEGTEGFQIRRGGGWVAGMQGKTGEGLSFTTRGISLDGMSNSEDMIVDPPAVGRWTHIVCVLDAVNGVKKVYFDSKLIQESATEAEAVLGAASQNASLGARANSDNTGFEALFNGALDEVRIYDRVLSDAEIRYLSDPTP